MVAVQHLAPRLRAALILRDVLGWPARGVADLLGDSVNSVNSALQRARARLREHLPPERQDWAGADWSGVDDRGTREAVRRYTEASVASDLDALAAMLRDDVRFAMPPSQGLLVGRQEVVASWTADGFPQMTGFRAVPTTVNRQPAIAYHLWREDAGAYMSLTLDVLRISGGTVIEVTIFDADRFAGLGCPRGWRATMSEALLARSGSRPWMRVLVGHGLLVTAARSRWRPSPR